MANMRFLSGVVAAGLAVVEVATATMFGVACAVPLAYIAYLQFSGKAAALERRWVG